MFLGKSLVKSTNIPFKLSNIMFFSNSKIKLKKCFVLHWDIQCCVSWLQKCALVVLGRISMVGLNWNCCCCTFLSCFPCILNLVYNIRRALIRCDDIINARHALFSHLPTGYRENICDLHDYIKWNIKTWHESQNARTTL